MLPIVYLFTSSIILPRIMCQATFYSQHQVYWFWNTCMPTRIHTPPHTLIRGSQICPFSGVWSIGEEITQGLIEIYLEASEQSAPQLQSNIPPSLGCSVPPRAYTTNPLLRAHRFRSFEVCFFFWLHQR